MEGVKSSVREYWNWRSVTYGSDTDKAAGIADDWVSILDELTPEPRGKRALDVGTGTGDFAVYLARIGFEVTGIDISEEMIRRTRKNASAQGLDIDLRTGDAEDVGFGDGTFDVVTARNLLWTLPRPERALREWRRVLKPGGTLIISDGLWSNTTWKSLHRLAGRLFERGFRKGGATPLRFFRMYAPIMKELPFYEGLSFENARNLLREAGFKNIEPYDTSAFRTNPYAGKNGGGNTGYRFFIARARV